MKIKKWTLSLVGCGLLLAGPTLALDQPDPTGPVRGAVTNGNPCLEWGEVTDAGWYRVWLRRDGISGNALKSSFSVGHWVEGGSNTELCVDSRVLNKGTSLQPGNYTWWVKAFTTDGLERSPWSLAASFEVVSDTALDHEGRIDALEVAVVAVSNAFDVVTASNATAIASNAAAIAAFDMAVSNAFIAADHVVTSNLCAKIDVVSNIVEKVSSNVVTVSKAFVTADTVVTSNVCAKIDAVSNHFDSVTAVNAAGIASNEIKILVAGTSAIINSYAIGVNDAAITANAAAITAGDMAVSNAFLAADHVVTSNLCVKIDAVSNSFDLVTSSNATAIASNTADIELIEFDVATLTGAVEMVESDVAALSNRVAALEAEPVILAAAYIDIVHDTQFVAGVDIPIAWITDDNADRVVSAGDMARFSRYPIGLSAPFTYLGAFQDNASEVAQVITSTSTQIVAQLASGIVIDFTKQLNGETFKAGRDNTRIKWDDVQPEPPVFEIIVNDVIDGFNDIIHDFLIADHFVGQEVHLSDAIMVTLPGAFPRPTASVNTNQISPADDAFINVYFHEQRR